MDLENKIDELNSNLENDETKKEAIILKHKLKMKSLTILIASSIIFLASITTFIILMIIGLKSFDNTILYSIIPFILTICSIFGIFYGMNYYRLYKSINI